MFWWEIAISVLGIRRPSLAIPSTRPLLAFLGTWWASCLPLAGGRGVTIRITAILLSRLGKPTGHGTTTPIGKPQLGSGLPMALGEPPRREHGSLCARTSTKRAVPT